MYQPLGLDRIKSQGPSQEELTLLAMLTTSGGAWAEGSGRSHCRSAQEMAAEGGEESSVCTDMCVCVCTPSRG